MNCKTLILALIFGAVNTLEISAAHAENESTEVLHDNAEQRINFSGKLRMLSQRIPSATCHLAQDVDPTAATALLSASIAEFEEILTALEVGDTDLNIIVPETNRRTLEAIDVLRSRWEPLRQAAEAVANGTASASDRAYVLNQNLQVLEAAQLLVGQLTRQYSNPNAMSMSSLLMIDISGRQRMLSQRMSKESCMIQSGIETAELRENLQNTMQVFENSLGALRDGMEDVGIQPPPNDKIASGLIQVAAEWESVKPHLSEVLAGGEIHHETDVFRFQGLNTIMVNMNKVVGMYEEAVPRLEPLL